MQLVIERRVPVLLRWLPFDTGPCVARLWLEDLAELGHGFRLGVEWSVLILATVPNPTPACEQNIQVNSLLINNLKRQNTIYQVETIKKQIEMLSFFFFWLSDKRDTMNVIDQKVLYINILYININWPIKLSCQLELVSNDDQRIKYLKAVEVVHPPRSLTDVHLG